MLVICGPTGSGKSALALAVAEAVGGELISCDSVQVYRGFDLGAAKATAAERAAVPHHLIDVADWRDDFDAAGYSALAQAALQDIARRGKVAIIVGGTGLYLRALLAQEFHQNLPKDAQLRRELLALPTDELARRLAVADPIRAAAIHANDRVRLVRALEIVTLIGQPVSSLAPAVTPADAPQATATIILDPSRSALHQAIAARTDQMLKMGLLDEVRALRAAGVTASCKPMQSIGYKQCTDHLSGAVSADELPDLIKAATRQYAKRQTTWFKKYTQGDRLALWDTASVIQRLKSLLEAH